MGFPELAALAAMSSPAAITAVSSKILPHIAHLAAIPGEIIAAVKPLQRWSESRCLLAERIFATSAAGDRARSSAGEHYVDIVGVTGSIPVAPTIILKTLSDRTALASVSPCARPLPIVVYLGWFGILWSRKRQSA